MRCARPAIAANPALFGRRRHFVDVASGQPTAMAEDVRLFLTTFAAGFAFVALFIA